MEIPKCPRCGFTHPTMYELVSEAEDEFEEEYPHITQEDSVRYLETFVVPLQE